MDDDTVRIIVATDNHLGFCERDPVRCDDSFAAFEEVLQTAKRKNADFILLAGDLFHENKPSRRTLHATIELLRIYCLGEDPVFIEILNDQKEIFKNSFGRANYEDPFQSVSLPIFSIHGNHDDPSREGGLGDPLAALDLLSASNLINYFGKAASVEDIEITPILLRKGPTNIAIYGLGAMRDERLNRMWNLKKVRFVRLTAEQGRDEYFNIFLIHQNRDLGRGTKNCIHESMIPEWMDLVIWGNEHECQPNLAESLVGTYRILQPGSSVACSLSISECSQFPKHMAFLEVKEKKFRMKPIRFSQVRQFIYGDIRLQDFEFLQPNNPKVDEQIKGILTTKINEMILEGRREMEEALVFDQRENPKFRIRDPQKVLVRLKVDYAGFTALNFPRFTSQFASDVANAPTIILAAKKRKDPIQRPNRRDLGNGGDEDEALRQMLGDADDDAPKVRIEDLVNETLAAGKHSLSLLTETEVAQALEDYIVKKELHAIEDLVHETLERTQAMLKSDQTTVEREAIVAAAEKIQRSSEEEIRKAGTTGPRAAKAGKERASSHFLDVEMADEPRSKTKGNGSRKKATSTIEDDDDDEVEEVQEDEDDDEEVPSKAKRGGSAAPGRVRAKTTANPRSKTAVEKHPPASSRSKPESTKRSSRAAASKVKAYVEIGSDDELIDEEGYNDSRPRKNDSDEDDAMEIEIDDVDDDDEEDVEAAIKPNRKVRGGANIAKTALIAKKTVPVSKSKVSAPSKSLGLAVKKSTKKKITDEEIDEEENNVWSKKTSTKATSSGVGNSRDEVISIDADENTSIFTGKSATSQLSMPTTATAKKRQLPISFSQSEKKPPSSSKQLATGWDD